MTFCPKCGAPLKAPAVSAVQQEAITRKGEKAEKREKKEKEEKVEKHEKSEFSFVGLIIGGLILVIIGLTSYMQLTGIIDVKVRETLGAVFLIALGVALLVGAFYVMTTARKRNPMP